MRKRFRILVIIIRLRREKSKKVFYRSKLRFELSVYILDVCWCMYVCQILKRLFNYTFTTIVYLKSVIKHKALHHGSTRSQLTCPWHLGFLYCDHPIALKKLTILASFFFVIVGLLVLKGHLKVVLKGHISLFSTLEKMKHSKFYRISWQGYFSTWECG